MHARFISSGTLAHGGESQVDWIAQLEGRLLRGVSIGESEVGGGAFVQGKEKHNGPDLEGQVVEEWELCL